MSSQGSELKLNSDPCSIVATGGPFGTGVLVDGPETILHALAISARGPMMPASAAAHAGRNRHPYLIRRVRSADSKSRRRRTFIVALVQTPSGIPSCIHSLDNWMSASRPKGQRRPRRWLR